jgi:phosphopantothenoylcysteine decarboxylase/phosphopantothenate--cysteine ligase
MLDGKQILLIISGGIAAYKSLYLIRLLRTGGAAVRTVLTAAATEFVTPLSAAALSEDAAYTDLFSLADEREMGHIRLSREADLLVVAPATANLMAKMAIGLADDLASTVLLASDKPVLLAPAMNTMMWHHPATQSNLATLRRRGVHIVGPASGDLACGETGAGRMSEPERILEAVVDLLRSPGPLTGRRALVTSGPTHEPIDPVRYLANHSSGRQGHAIAHALAEAGAAVTLVSGPTSLTDPPLVDTVRVSTARQMLAACREALPVDVAVCAAAVCDWRVANAATAKTKKDGGPPPRLELTENPDILATLSSKGNDRPQLVIGFAAETEDVLAHARAKRERKSCDWIVANDVSPGSATFGAEDNTVHLITADAVDSWPRMSKLEVGRRLAVLVAEHLT